MAHRGKTEPLNGLLRVTAPHEWFIVIGLGVAILAVVLWGFLGRIDRAVAINCVLVHPGERHDVISTSTGSIVDVLVQVGDTVESGQPIARISVHDLGQHVALARAQARVAAFEEQSNTSAEMLELARVELQELESAEEASELIVSPNAGIVTSHALALGQAVTTGTTVARILDTNITNDTSPPLEAIAYLPPGDANRIEVGMEATITSATPGNGIDKPLDAEVIFVAERQSPPPIWLGDFGAQAPSRSHLVRMNFSEQPQLRDGDICNARIVLSSDPPVQLLNFGAN